MAIDFIQPDLRFMPGRGGLVGAFDPTQQTAPNALQLLAQMQPTPAASFPGQQAMPQAAPAQQPPQAAQPAARSLGPSMTPNTAPAAPHGGGQQYMMGGGLGDFLRSNPTMISNLAAGLMSGSRGGVANAVASLPGAQQHDRQNAALKQWMGTLPEEQQGLARAFPQVAGQSALQAMFAQPKSTASMTEYEYARKQGFGGSYLDFVLAQKKAGAPSTNVNVDTAGNSFAKGLGDGLSDEFLDRRAAANEAVQSLGSIAEARKLLDSGVITGFGADFKVGLGKALKAAGFNYATDEVANTEAFVAAQAKEVGRIISLFGAGTGLSDKDREFATQAAAGNIEMSEESIRRILDINERAAGNVIRAYNADASRIPASMAPYPLTIDLEGGGWTDAGNGIRIREKP